MTPMKAWGFDAERMASTATVICTRRGTVSLRGSAIKAENN